MSEETPTLAELVAEANEHAALGRFREAFDALGKALLTTVAAPASE